MTSREAAVREPLGAMNAVSMDRFRQCLQGTAHEVSAFERWALLDVREAPSVAVTTGNDGTVAVIEAERDHWTFATVQSPGDGLHPVSGNRQFGYTDNGDGTVTFYTRGVDRITNSGMVAANWVSGGAVFDGGDDLWQSFQQGVASYVRTTGGQAQVETPVIVRPNWSAVDDVLTGRESVQTFLARQSGSRR